jgi:adenylylsulfate kinase
MKTILFITGVSGAGKTTLSRAIKDLTTEFREVILIDGDIARTLWPDLGLSETDRKENVRRIANLSIILSQQTKNSLIIISCIAPYDNHRKKIIEKLKHNTEQFALIYVHAPLIERIKRDPKGLYDLAIRGEIKGLTGYDGQYDIPLLPNFSFNSSQQSPKEMAEQVLKGIK